MPGCEQVDPHASRSWTPPSQPLSADPMCGQSDLWNEDGVIIYANDPRLIGEQFAMPAETTDDAPKGCAIADPNRPENRYLDPGANWVQVSLPLVSEDGSRYLFQVSKRAGHSATRCPQCLDGLRPLLAGSMVLLAALLGLLAIRMARRISDELRTREGLLRSAMDASELERRRIAADLHDGTVQQLAGVSYALAGMAARANASGDADSRAAPLGRRRSFTNIPCVNCAPCWWTSTRPTLRPRDWPPRSRPCWTAWGQTWKWIPISGNCRTWTQGPGLCCTGLPGRRSPMSANMRGVTGCRSTPAKPTHMRC